MTAVFDCGDFYFFGNHQKYQVEAVLADELGIENITVREITWEEHDRQVNMKPIRIQRKRTKDWRMPENTVYVGNNNFC